MQWRYALTSACGGAALLVSTQALSTTLVGPVYPPPGGVTFSSNGVNAVDTGRVGTYSNFDLTASNALYFGLSPIGLAMDGAINSPGETLTYSSALSDLLNGIAVFTGTTTVNSFGVDQTVYDRFTATFTDLSNNPLSIATNPDVSGGAFPVLTVLGSYKVGQGFTASSSLNGSYISASSYFSNAHAPSTPGLLKSSISGGFYYEPVAAVPEPGTWALMLLGFMGMGAAVRRSSRKSSSRIMQIV